MMSEEKAFRLNPGTALLAALALLLLILAQGCATPSRLPAVPQELRDQAQVHVMTGIRFWPDEDPNRFMEEGYASVKREREHLAASGHSGPLPPSHILALSGGGDDGAFGAGLLVGWTDAGDRPRFKGVTGISTGALIAPFAFLGPQYDDVLREVYTNVSQEEIFRPRNILAAVFGDGMADTTPLWNLLKRYVNEELLAAIAAEYEKGRLLFIGTTNLDDRVAVIWNMGKIATYRNAEAVGLFQKIMLASASIPGAFPPVLIDVKVDGKPHQEMHVDGGTIQQVFLYPPAFKLGEVAEAKGIERDRKLYVIRNARLDPKWMEVERRTLSIAGRAVSTLIQMQGIGDLDRIYMMTVRDGFDYNLAYIPGTFNVPHKEDFDTEYMRQLFNLGYELALKGYPWKKFPPGFDSSPLQ
jgi:predicted acylesterase/phospholipase RssA